MLAASDGADDLRIYSLDERMTNVEVTDEVFEIPSDFDSEEFFLQFFWRYHWHRLGATKSQNQGS